MNKEKDAERYLTIIRNDYFINSIKTSLILT